MRLTAERLQGIVPDIVVLRLAIRRGGAKREFGAALTSAQAGAAPATVGGERPFDDVTEEDASGRRNGPR